MIPTDPQARKRLRLEIGAREMRRQDRQGQRIRQKLIEQMPDHLPSERPSNWVDGVYVFGMRHG